MRKTIDHEKKSDERCLQKRRCFSIGLPGAVRSRTNGQLILKKKQEDNSSTYLGMGVNSSSRLAVRTFLFLPLMINKTLSMRYEIEKMIRTQL